MVGQGAEAEMALPSLCTSLPEFVNFRSMNGPKLRFRERTPFFHSVIASPAKSGERCVPARRSACLRLVGQADVTARRRGNLIEKGEIASVPSQ